MSEYALRSEHFVVQEFDCHSGVEYPVEWIGDRLQVLVDTLEVIRHYWGGPLVVICGYRTADYNARLAARSSGVARNSQHVQGRAADVRPSQPSTARVMELHYLVLKLHGEGKLPRLGGLGVYPRWIHVDVRAGSGHLARWTGSGVGSEK